MEIYLLKGKIASGKTSYLMNYIANHPNCAGILSPVIEGRRYFFDISSSEIIKMEAEQSETEFLEIGKYKFSVSAFEWAIQKIREAENKPNDLLIIDEIGPLELKGNGFATLVNELIKKDVSNLKLLLVVREHAVIQVLDYFNVDQEKVKYWQFTAYSTQ
jgi:nucleoside-triphosphatase THEP1